MLSRATSWQGALVAGGSHKATGAWWWRSSTRLGPGSRQGSDGTIRRWICREHTCQTVTFLEHDERMCAPRARLGARAIRWAIRQLRFEGATIAGLARQLATTWNTVWSHIKPCLQAASDDPARFAGVRVPGVDKHVWHHQDRRRRRPRQSVLIRVQDGLIGEPVALKMLACAGVKPRRHGSIRALPRESRQNGYQSLPGRRVPSTPSTSVHPGAPSRRRPAPSPPEDALGAEPATQPGHTRAQPHQPTPESAHQSQELREEDAHS